MTEYTTSPEAYGEYMSARERTTRWVQVHSSDTDGFYSPSIPPTPLEGVVPSSPPSDAGSSHSLPPKMVLRYKDGRPDIPIPGPGSRETSHRRAHKERHGHPAPQRSHTSVQNSHSSHATHSSHHSSHSNHQRNMGTPSVSHARHPGPLGVDNSAPEEIRVLPSNAPSSNHSPHTSPIDPASMSSPHHQNPHHFHSRPIPRTTIDPLATTEFIDPNPAAAPHSAPIAYPPQSSHHFPSHSGPGPWHGGHSSSSSTKYSHGHSNHHKNPPAIVYAPSHHNRAAHYAPPPMLYHQPQRGANGIIYSHSAPVPIQGGVYPAPGTVNDFRERERRDRRRSLDPPQFVHKVQRSDDGEESDGGSVRSGSTYYVLPSPGQKVHVIAPRTKEPVHMATSTNQSPDTGPRRTFFQRLFGFAKVGTATGEVVPRHRRKLQRRHSTGDSGRPCEPECRRPMYQQEGGREEKNVMTPNVTLKRVPADRPAQDRQRQSTGLPRKLTISSVA